MLGSTSLLTYEIEDSVKLYCEIDLNKLLPTQSERRRFEDKWEFFLNSDKANEEIFELRSHTLCYESEQLIPSKKDKRPPLLLVLGNPASHSVKEGMFFSFEGDRKEHRFWKNILKPAGVLNMSFNSNLSVKVLNKQRKEQLIDLEYKSPFRIGLCVFISIPSAPGGKWGGIAGIQKLIGIKALRMLEIEETRRIQACAEKFIGQNGKVVVFQKNAWNALCSDGDPKYRIDLAKKGLLNGNLENPTGIEILGVPPTRLIGPCRRVLGQLLVRR